MSRLDWIRLDLNKMHANSCNPIAPMHSEKSDKLDSHMKVFYEFKISVNESALFSM